MEIMTWDDQGEGIFVPVHQEPVDCRRGEPEPPHPRHCQCGGTGKYRRDGYRELCLGPVPPQPPTGADPWMGDDPWKSAAAAGPAIPAEPPF